MLSQGFILIYYYNFSYLISYGVLFCASPLESDEHKPVWIIKLIMKNLSSYWINKFNWCLKTCEMIEMLLRATLKYHANRKRGFFLCACLIVDDEFGNGKNRMNVTFKFVSSSSSSLFSESITNQTEIDR